MEWYQWLAAILGLIGTLFALYKWIVIRLDKRRADLRETHGKQLADHSSRLDRHTERMDRMDKLIRLTREDMHNNYIKLGHLERMEGSIDKKMSEMFTRINAMARDLNQAIGTLKASHENEVRNLIEKIGEAVEHGSRSQK